MNCIYVLFFLDHK